MDREEFLQQLHTQFGLAQPVITDLAVRATGGRVAGVERVVAGDEYEVHRVRLSGGGVVYARICRPGMRPGKAAREAWAMDQARAGGVPTPEVLAVEDIADGDHVREAMVVAAVPGRQLATVLPELTRSRRWAVMADVGRVLGRLHGVPMPGLGVPDVAGGWPDPATIRKTYLASVTADCDHLVAVGFTTGEVERIGALVERSLDVLVGPDPVLCHGDASPVHVFVDAGLRVRGLIDWGMWNGGCAIGDLASVAMRNDPADFAAIAAGHPAGTLADPAFRQAIALATIPQTVGEIAWNIRSGQVDNTATLTATLRQALSELAAEA